MAQTREHRPRGERFEAASDSLEYFLTERDCLYTLDEHLRVLRAEIAPPPWALQLADAGIEENTMAGLLIWPLSRVGGED